MPLSLGRSPLISLVMCVFSSFLHFSLSFQGRLPIRVELKPLTETEMYRILTEPQNNLVRQQTALLETEVRSRSCAVGAGRRCSRVTFSLLTFICPLPTCPLALTPAFCVSAVLLRLSVFLGAPAPHFLPAPPPARRALAFTFFLSVSLAQGVKLRFEDAAIRQIAAYCAEINHSVENIGARSASERERATEREDRAERRSGRPSFVCMCPLFLCASIGPSACVCACLPACSLHGLLTGPSALLLATYPACAPARPPLGPHWRADGCLR